MQRFKLFAPLILFLVLVVFLSRSLRLDPHTLASPLVGKSIPTFQAPELYNPKKIIDEKIFIGRVSVLNIFATWCIACRAEHGMLIQLHQQKPKVQMVGLAFKDQQKELLHYLQKWGNPFDVVINDRRGDVGINLGVYGTPETFIIDRQGVIRSKIIGPISPEILKKQVLPMINQLSKKS